MNGYNFFNHRLSVRALSWNAGIFALLLAVALSQALTTSTGPYDGGFAGRLAAFLFVRLLLLALGLRDSLIFRIGAVVTLAVGYTFFQDLVERELGVIDTIPMRLHFYGHIFGFGLLFSLDYWAQRRQRGISRDKP